MPRKLKTSKTHTPEFNRAEQFIYYVIQSGFNVFVCSEDVEDAVKLSSKILSASSFATKNAKVVSGIETFNKLFRSKKVIRESEFVREKGKNRFYSFIDLQTCDGLHKVLELGKSVNVSMLYAAQAVGSGKFIDSLISKLNSDIDNNSLNNHMIKSTINYYVEVIKNNVGEPVIESIKEFRFNIRTGKWEEVLIFKYGSLSESYVCIELPTKVTLMDMWHNLGNDKEEFRRFILEDMLIM